MSSVDRVMLTSCMESKVGYAPASEVIVGLLKTMNREMISDLKDATDSENVSSPYRERKDNNGRKDRGKRRDQHGHIHDEWCVHFPSNASSDDCRYHHFFRSEPRGSPNGLTGSSHALSHGFIWRDTSPISNMDFAGCHRRPLSLCDTPPLVYHSEDSR